MCCDQAFNVYVRRRSGLLEKFEPPELTISAAISRGWEKVGPILRQRPPEFLPTYPLPWKFEVPGSWEGPPVDLTYLRPLGGRGYWAEAAELLSEIWR